MTLAPCVYASATRGLHDRRWIGALRSQGFDPIAVVRRADEDDDAFRSRVAQAADGAPVLAGPLDSVALALTGLPRVVGLSWGFDLHRMAEQRRRSLRELHGLIVDSEATKALAIGAGVDAAAITFLPWGVDLDAFSPTGPGLDPARWALPPGASLVVSLRALEAEYGVSDIVEAWPMVVSGHPGAHLLIGNDGSLRDQLEAQVTALGAAGTVSFIGSLPEGELPALLRSASAYVSMSRIDGTSVTLLQAMACGAPVVVSDIPGNRPWIDDAVSGRLVSIGDRRGLARAIGEALDRGAGWTAPARSLVERDADWPANGRRLRAALGAG